MKNAFLRFGIITLALITLSGCLWNEIVDPVNETTVITNTVDDVTTVTDTTTISVSTDPLNFIPDAGIRQVDASNPGVKFTESGDLELLFESQPDHRPKISIATAASDWLEFTLTSTTASADNFRALKLPDGTCRAYGFNNTKGLTSGTQTLTSRSSEDCLTFTEDAGSRYTLQPEDNGTMGVYDLFNDSKGGVVLLYIGDMYGVNNIRRAYSTDNGWTFTFTNDNVLGDETAGGGGNSFVDEKTVTLSDGRILLVTMKSGKVYTFISADDGVTFTQEAGVRLDSSDFTDLDLMGLNDPQIIALPDGRYRIYVTAYYEDKTQSPVIISATSAAVL